MIRLLVALLAVATLAALGWHASSMLPQGRWIPGFTRFVVVFHAGLALPYLATLAGLARRDGRGGMRLALCAGLVNSLWALPLGGLLALFAGFTMGNRDQLHAIFALVTGAALQLPLLAVAGAGLRRRHREGSAEAAARAWLLALALPIAASGSSWLYLNWQVKAFQARSAQAARNDRAAKETVQALQACLAGYRERGYPATLDACPEAAARTGEASGYRFEYLPAPARPGQPSGAYMLCAQPIEFRATGFDTIVADGAGRLGAGAAEGAPPSLPPTCASVLTLERAMAWCAYAQAARNPARGYPARLEEIESCVSARRTVRVLGADRLQAGQGDPYVYLADAPDANGQVTRFRVYRLAGSGGAASWIDSDLREIQAKFEPPGPVLGGLPDLAAPERFAPACAEGRAAQCFAAGHEWQRKARQSARDERDPSVAALRLEAMKAFERGCELGDGRACSWLAQEVSEAGTAERDVQRIAALHEKACALGYATGCRNAAQMYESGRKARLQTLHREPPPAVPKADLARDVARAVELYGRACELHEREACFIAARLLAGGEGLAPDRARALGLFAALCDEGWALACARAAPLDVEREKDFMRRACVLGEAAACG